MSCNGNSFRYRDAEGNLPYNYSTAPVGTTDSVVRLPNDTDEFRILTINKQYRHCEPPILR